MPFGAPPGTPCFVPPGDAERRALRLPFGISMLGEGGAGFADSETSRRKARIAAGIIARNRWRCSGVTGSFLRARDGPTASGVAAGSKAFSLAMHRSRMRQDRAWWRNSRARHWQSTEPDRRRLSHRACARCGRCWRRRAFSEKECRKPLARCSDAPEFGALFSICGTAASSGRRACITGALAGFTGILRSGMLPPDCARGGSVAATRDECRAQRRIRGGDFSGWAQERKRRFAASAWLEVSPCPIRRCSEAAERLSEAPAERPGWINVWRGCVTRCGCERMVWRGL